MHLKDLKLQKIKYEDLIPETTFNEIMNFRNQKISENKLELIEYQGNLITKGKLYSIKTQENLSDEQKLNRSVRFQGSNNIACNPETLYKIRNTKSTTLIDGKTLDTISAERAAETMNKEFVNTKGEITTQYKENGKKISDFYKTEVLLSDSSITTKGALRAEKHKQKLRDKSKKYILKNIFDEEFTQEVPAYELRLISPDLQSKTKDNYLGKSKFGQTYFKNANKEHLIGLYVEEPD